MIKYEMTVLLEEDNDLKEVTNLLSSSSVSIIGEKSWGRVPLAYKIKKLSSGYYHTFQFEVEPEKVSNIIKGMNYNDKIIRYLLLKVDQKEGFDKIS